MERGGERLRRIQAEEVARARRLAHEDIREDEDMQLANDDDDQGEEGSDVDPLDNPVDDDVDREENSDDDDDDSSDDDSSDDEDLRIEDWPPERWDAYVAAMIHDGHSFEVDNDDEQSEDDDVMDDDVMDDGVTDNDDDVVMQVDDAAERSAAMAPGALRHAPIAAVTAARDASEDASAPSLHDDASIASEDASVLAHRDDDASIASTAAAALIDSDHEDDAVVVDEQPDDEASDLFMIATNSSSSMKTQLQGLLTEMQNDPQFIATEDFGVGNVGIDTTRVPRPQPTFDILAHPDGRLKVEVFKKEDGTMNVEELKLAHIDVNNNSNLHPNQKALLHTAYAKHEQLCQDAIDQSTWSKTKKKRIRLSCLYERHHIIPTSCGGSNHDYNLVYILIKDHIKIHGYLSVMFSNPGLHSIFCYMTSTSRCRGLISMQQLQATLTQDHLLQSLVFARAENRSYKLSIHQKVKNGDVLDEDEKKYYDAWEKGIRKSQKLRKSIIQKIKDGSLQYNDLTAADYITIKHLVAFISSSSGSGRTATDQRKWDRQFSSAVSYQLEFGHLHVPEIGHWKKLGKWLAKQRTFKNSESDDPRSVALTELGPRCVALTELGFVWNLSQLKWNRKMKSIFKFFDTAYYSDTNLRQKVVQGLLMEGYDSDTEVVKIGNEIQRLRLRILHQCNLVDRYLPREHNNHRIRNQHLTGKPPDLNRSQIQDLITNNFCMPQKISLKFFLTRQPICYKFEDATNFV